MCCVAAASLTSPCFIDFTHTGYLQLAGYRLVSGGSCSEPFAVAVHHSLRHRLGMGVCGSSAYAEGVNHSCNKFIETERAILHTTLSADTPNTVPTLPSHVHIVSVDPLTVVLRPALEATVRQLPRTRQGPSRARGKTLDAAATCPRTAL